MTISIVTRRLAAALAASLWGLVPCASPAGPPSGGDSVAEARLLEALQVGFAEDARLTLAGRKRSADWHIGALLDLRRWCEQHQPARSRTMWCRTWSAMGPADDLPVAIHWECHWDGWALHARVRWCDPAQPSERLDFPVWPEGLELSLFGGTVQVNRVAGGTVPSPRDCRMLAQLPFQPIGDAYDIFDAASHWWREQANDRVDWLPLRVVPPASERIESAWCLGNRRGQQRVSARLHIRSGWQLSISTLAAGGSPDRRRLLQLQSGGVALIAEWSVDSIDWGGSALCADDPLARERRQWPLEASLASQPDGGRMAWRRMHSLGSQRAPSREESPSAPTVPTVPVQAAESVRQTIEEAPTVTAEMLLQQILVLHEEARFWHRVGGARLAAEVAGVTHQAWTAALAATR